LVEATTEEHCIFHTGVGYRYHGMESRVDVEDSTMEINVREYRRGNQKWAIHSYNYYYFEN
jgi:hypothetical protein